MGREDDDEAGDKADAGVRFCEPGGEIPLDVDGVGTARDDDRGGDDAGRVDIGGRLRGVVSGD